MAKVIFLGDSSVGKTSPVNCYHDSAFCEAPEVTIGASYDSLSVKIATSNITLTVWDTAGHKRFSSVIPMNVRDSTMVVLVCSTD
jgi:small GTP-binding protein